MDDICCGGSAADGVSGSDSVHGDPSSPEEQEAVSVGDIDAPSEEEVRDGGNDEEGSAYDLADSDTESLRGRGGCWETGCDGLGEEEEEFGAAALVVVVTDDKLES
mmetsp:Transcript_14429/g.23883  ORF Transcript_14429/g.23883 Transcript_14429/m.23883 type:complete len:106 (-) Transcript_14429:119-436(-)